MNEESIDFITNIFIGALFFGSIDQIFKFFGFNWGDYIFATVIVVFSIFMIYRFIHTFGLFRRQSNE